MSTSKQREPYLTHYRTNILSKLREIDLFIKTQPAPYSKERVIKILDMPSSEFDRITSELGIGCITPFSLVLIMKTAPANFVPPSGANWNAALQIHIHRSRFHTYTISIFQ